MEGILFDIEMFGSPIALLSGLALLAIAGCAILLGRMADKEAEGHEVFWAESPFTDVSEAPAGGVKYPKAA
ncbi:MAG: hypothetical protein FIA93_10775 [Deltaproteobacteria bacterium]|nr:hypothetical protein [Deltaproteobacteria bacterium]PWB63094.1 MAG: hypothetical protein C3F14_08855 [Deltaproteobacteria bacterium]